MVQRRSLYSLCKWQRLPGIPKEVLHRTVRNIRWYKNLGGDAIRAYSDVEQVVWYANGSDSSDGITTATAESQGIGGPGMLITPFEARKFASQFNVDLGSWKPTDEECTVGTPDEYLDLLKWIFGYTQPCEERICFLEKEIDVKKGKIPNIEERVYFLEKEVAILKNKVSRLSWGKHDS